MINGFDASGPDDDPETHQRGIEDLERICQEWVEEFGPSDPLVVNLRRAIAEERQRFGATGEALAQGS